MDLTEKQLKRREYNKRHIEKRKNLGLPSRDPKHNKLWRKRMDETTPGWRKREGAKDENRKAGFDKAGKREKEAGDFCILCERIYKDMKHKANYDHCHSCGEFRGWICGSCNRSLGLIRDNIQTIDDMIEYLKLHSKVCIKFL